MKTDPSQATPPEQTRIEYITLEHWRGLAALMVMAFHTTLPVEATVHPLLGAFRSAAQHGPFGVHLFFVISGFCIASNVHRLSRQGLRAWDFLRDRLLRIYPVYWCACAVTILMSLASIPLTHLDWHLAFPADFKTFTGNLLLIEPHLGVAPFFIVSWTLGYEIGFYLLVAAGIFLYRAGCRFDLLCAAAFGLAVLGQYHIPFHAAYVLWLWNEFLMGSLVYLALHSRNISRLHERLCLAAIVALVATSWLFTNPHVASICAGAATFALLLYFLYPWDGKLARSRILSVFKTVGIFSYSLYLIHVALYIRIHNLMDRVLHPGGPWHLLNQWIIWTGVLLGCWLFYKLFEEPLEKWRRSLKRARLRR